MLYLLLVLILAWIIIIDRNVLDYLCLELSRLRIALITRLFKYRLLWGLKWDRFLMNRGYVPRKYAKMAKDILSKTSEKP